MTLTPAEQHVDHVLDTLRRQREKGRAKYGRDLSENWDCDDDAQAEVLELAAKRLVATARRCRDMARGIRLLQKGRQ